MNNSTLATPHPLGPQKRKREKEGNKVHKPFESVANGRRYETLSHFVKY